MNIPTIQGRGKPRLQVHRDKDVLRLRIDDASNDELWFDVQLPLQFLIGQVCEMDPEIYFGHSDPLDQVLEPVKDQASDEPEITT